MFFRFREQFLSKTIDDHLAILDQPTLTAHDLAGFAAAIADNNADWMHHIIEENGKLASLQDRFTPTGSAFIAVRIWFFEWYRKLFFKKRCYKEKLLIFVKPNSYCYEAASCRRKYLES